MTSATTTTNSNSSSSSRKFIKQRRRKSTSAAIRRSRACTPVNMMYENGAGIERVFVGFTSTGSPYRKRVSFFFASNIHLPATIMTFVSLRCELSCWVTCSGVLLYIQIQTRVCVRVEHGYGEEMLLASYTLHGDIRDSCTPATCGATNKRSYKVTMH